jgi:hypothetical protein
MTQAMHNEPAPSGYPVPAHRRGLAPGSKQGRRRRAAQVQKVIRATCPLKLIRTHGLTGGLGSG